jgi:hypothetical protein
VLGAFLFVFTSTGGAESPLPTSEIPVLEARLERLSAREDAKYAAGALDQARRALARAAEPDREPASASRSVEVARAALVLAERQLERRRTQEALFETQRRLTATKERAAAQRRVLEALLRERASLAREADQP